MKNLYTQEELEKAKSYDKLPRTCQYCEKTFYIQKRHLLAGRGQYCSNKCSGLSRTTKIVTSCKNCGTEITKRQCFVKKSKTNNYFCSQSCASTYNNTHKTKGTRKSKLEKYIENKLIEFYPNIKIDFNQKNAINSELDIYIPKLKLAFEINGIFHYEPIFGEEKLTQIKNNDCNKIKLCLKHDIELHVIDCSLHKHVTERTCEKYLNDVVRIIQEKVG